jgi:hypothetical protein
LIPEKCAGYAGKAAVFLKYIRIIGVRYKFKIEAE